MDQLSNLAQWLTPANLIAGIAAVAAIITIGLQLQANRKLAALDLPVISARATLADDWCRCEVTFRNVTTHAVEIREIRPKKPRRLSLALGEGPFPTRPIGVPSKVLRVQWAVPVNERLELQRVFFFRPPVERGNCCRFQFIGFAYDSRRSPFKITAQTSAVE